jgi:hypothetical protein
VRLDYTSLFYFCLRSAGLAFYFAFGITSRHFALRQPDQGIPNAAPVEECFLLHGRRYTVEFDNQGADFHLVSINCRIMQVKPMCFVLRLLLLPAPLDDLAPCQTTGISLTRTYSEACCAPGITQAPQPEHCEAPPNVPPCPSCSCFEFWMAGQAGSSGTTAKPRSQA